MYYVILELEQVAQTARLTQLVFSYQTHLRHWRFRHDCEGVEQSPTLVWMVLVTLIVVVVVTAANFGGHELTAYARKAS